MFPQHFGWGACGLLVAVLCSAPAMAQHTDSSSLSAPFTPNDAVAAALLNHVRIRSADAAVQTAQGNRLQSTLFLHNPSASTDFGVGSQHFELSVTQPFSLTGEGLAAKRTANANLSAAESIRERTRFEVAALARLAHSSAAASQAHLVLAQRNVSLIRRLREGVALRLEVGEGSALELRLARMAEATAAGRLLDDRASSVTALRQLARITASPLTADAVGTDPLAAAPMPTGAPKRTRMDVTAAEHGVAAARANLTRQRAKALPALALGVNVESDAGVAVIGPALSMDIPLFDRNQSGRAAAKGAVSVADAQLRVATAVAQTEQATASIRHAEATEVVNSVGPGLQEDALEALNGIDLGYRAGQFDLVTAVTLQRQIIEGQAASIDLQHRLASARIDLLLATEDPALLAEVTP